MEDIICPACGTELDLEDLENSLVCPHCKTKWMQNKYKDFLEMLVYEDIIDNIDFSKLNTYGSKIDEELLNLDEEESLSPSGASSKHDRLRDDFDEFEDDAELHKERNKGTISEDDWDIFSDDVALEEDWDDSPDSEKGPKKKDDNNKNK